MCYFWKSGKWLICWILRVVCVVEACEKAGVRYEFKKLKSGFVVCFYRSEKSEDNSTDITVKSTDKYG